MLELTEYTQQSTHVTRGAMLPQNATDELVIGLWLRLKNKSPKTQAAYTSDLARFQTYVQKPLAAITLLDLLDYQDTLLDLGLATQTRLLASIKSLLSFCYKSGYLTVNVGAALQLEAPPDTLSMRILTEEQVMSMIILETDTRNRLLIRVLYSAGLRVSELCALQWKHLQVNHETGQITILYGKGRKTRVVLLNPDTYRLLVAYRGDSSPDAFMFTSHAGKPLERSAVWHVVEKAAIRAGIETYEENGGTRSKVSPHWLRHAHASHFLQRNGDLMTLRDTLGWADFKMASRYSHARPNTSSSLLLPL